MIALYILAAILLLVFVLLLIPVQVRVWVHGEFQAKLQYAFFKIPLYPPVKKEEKSEASSQEADGSNTDSNPVSDLISGLFEKETFADSLIELCELLKELIGKSVTFLRRITLQNVRLDITVGEEDAADTGIRFGQICAGVYSLRGVAEGVFKIKNSEVNIKPDFTHAEKSLELDLHLKLCPILAVGPLIKLLIRYFKFYRNYHKERTKTKKDGVSK